MADSTTEAGKGIVANMADKKLNWFFRLIRYEPGIALGQWAYERITAFVAIFIGAGGMSYLASITNWMAAWGPLGIGAVTVTTALVIWIALAIAQDFRARARLRQIEGDAAEKWKEQVDRVNPLDDAFHKQRIRLSDLAHPVSNSISNKRFTDCELIGPAVLVLVGTGEVIDVSFSNCDMALIKPGTYPVHNAIRMESIRIIGGSIWNCTVLVPQHMLPAFRAMGAHFITLTGAPAIDGPKLPEPAAEMPQ